MSTTPLLPFEQEPPKKKGGFKVIRLAGSKKLQRLYNVLLAAKAQGRQMSSLELTLATKLTAISTWKSHLTKPPNNIAVEVEQRTVNGEQVWFYWIP